jgi:UDP-N-acetylmuramate-alanine ligase
LTFPENHRIKDAGAVYDAAPALYCPTLQDVTTQIKSMAQPGDLILTVGAGDIYKAGDAVLIKD